MINSKPRIIGSLGMPIFMLLALGGGIGALVKDFNYQAFILPGVLGQVLLFNSIFSGVSVIWDRQFGFLKEMLVTPTKRTTLAIGRMMGGATTSVFQGILILIIGMTLNIIPVISAIDFALLVVLMFIIACAFVGLGISIASTIEEAETFQVIMNFIVMPIFFLSNALFPTKQLPNWLQTVAGLNPLSYAIDGFRNIIIGESQYPLMLSFTYCSAFLITIVFVSTYLFKKAKI